ncbi:MAG: DNA mismatch repair protein MutS [Chloroflexota bacterium]
MARVTPVRQQYLDVKAEYPDCVVLFRLGDFYELFDEDAEIASRELDIALTGRTYGKNPEKIPMAGVPHHAVDSYIPKLLAKGYHVAICDQVGEVTGKGPVERAVTRVLTPGTLIEPTMLPEDRSNYLLALLPVGDPNAGEWYHAGIAYVDISTGEFAATQLSGESVGVSVLEELARLSPSEVVMPETWAQRGVTLPEGIHLSQLDDWRFEGGNAEQALLNHFHVQTLDGYGLGGKPYATCAAGAVLSYLRDTQKNSLAQLTKLRTYSTDNFMVLDPFTRRNLELTETIRGGRTRGSLLGVLDRTVTPMGARLLRTWMSQPLLDLKRLSARLDAVEELTRDGTLRAELDDALRSVSDLERLTNRLTVGKANPRDLLALRASLDIVPVLQQLIDGIPALEPLLRRLDPCDAVRDHIGAAITDDPPAVLNTMGAIRPGYSKDLDDIMDRSKHARDWIAGLEGVERKRTKIDKLKVGYNKVFGYYIEVTKAQTSKVPEDYIRKQTLVNAERYITPEMKEYETLVLNAEEEILDVERDLFELVCKDLSHHSEPMLNTARAIAHIDVLLSLAQVAVREGYVRPTLTEDDMLIVRSGRHPVVEQMLGGGVRYVANDTHFDTDSRVHIITGPNMSGKSTYIRQVAIITLMAQIGSFVPADEAVIGLTDRIFARIGAQDEIHAGQSTFMVEMVETARLLSGSTERSLLFLDEVGRGTSTYDGLAIARAVIEYIHNSPRLNCRTLFATHYHELTELPNILPRAGNYNVAVSEKGDDIVFLHKVVPGGADRSYGVHVAQLAGMPRPVVDRARELLAQLESESSNYALDVAEGNGATGEEPQQFTFMDLQGGNLNPAIKAIREMQLDHLSPIEALTKLYELKRMAGED